ncbi:MAG: hypothetical protein SF053_05380 [Bacteroidia bacterium]|nr:hypothetical protein [Bacteroidia bacterium]
MQVYTYTDQRVHLICQAIAKAGRTYVPAQPDDSHTNLSYDTWGNRITGRWIETPAGPVCLTLSLESWQLQWLNRSQEVLHRYEIAGRTLAQLEAAVQEDLASLGLMPDGYLAPLHFEITAYPFVSQPFEEPDTEGLRAWTYWRTLAHSVSASLLNFLQTPGEIRIWPHHFDTGIYVIPPGKVGIGFGLAMEDSMIGEPYFYLAAYGQGQEFLYERLPSLAAGRWHLGPYWRGAVLPLGDLVSYTLAEQHDHLRAFATTASRWAISR